MIICFAHYKGGTGKTTSCLSIAGWLARFGKKVLVIDLDPQGNATSGLGIDKKTLNRTMYDVMGDYDKIKKGVIVETSIENINLAPATHQLEMLNLRVYNNKADAKILIKGIDKIKDYYDFILIDTPPVNSHFIINGMAAADKVLVVLDPGIFALEGVQVMKEHFGNFFDKLGMKLTIDGALITKVPQYSIFSMFKKNHIKDIKNEVENMLDKEVFLIPYSEEIYDTHRLGKPISHHKPRSKVGKVYEKIARKLIHESKEREEIEKQIKLYGVKHD